MQKSPVDRRPAMRSFYGLANKDIFPQQAPAQWGETCQCALFQMSETTRFTVRRTIASSEGGNWPANESGGNPNDSRNYQQAAEARR